MNERIIPFIKKIVKYRFITRKGFRVLLTILAIGEWYYGKVRCSRGDISINSYLSKGDVHKGLEQLLDHKILIKIVEGKDVWYKLNFNEKSWTKWKENIESAETVLNKKLNTDYFNFLKSIENILKENEIHYKKRQTIKNNLPI